MYSFTLYLEYLVISVVHCKSHLNMSALTWIVWVVVLLYQLGHHDPAGGVYVNNQFKCQDVGEGVGVGDALCMPK